jgi:hypothetical protein
MDRNFALEIAQLIGQPINTQLPVPVEIQAIADTFTALPGEKVYRFMALDTTADVVLDVSTGAIVTVKRNGVGDAEMTFKGLNSKLEYVLVDAVLASPDTDLLSRRKESITRAMDKKEVKLIVDAILSGSSATYFPGLAPEDLGTGADIYDVIVAMKHKVEDYGDGYVLLCASDVKEAIDNYDKAINATNVGGVSLPAKLRELGIEVVKMFGKVAVDTGESEVAIMPAGKMILVAKNSRMSEGKPIKFVRRLISPEIAKLMGATVDNAQRALIVNPTPVNLSGVNTLAYGVYGYESIIFCITNPKCIVVAEI